eukprot:TRINITY_DN1315_c0_g1_i2.p1 TRINITY_DN1315_c0_g1~~TRINITY_DN1315_c0_g1_i2.p1  ORF type:complete len:112 (+),score=1.33 TRINITY_DN1315_c0_g1_i2:871-1206(+)
MFLALPTAKQIMNPDPRSTMRATTPPRPMDDKTRCQWSALSIYVSFCHKQQAELWSTSVSPSGLPFCALRRGMTSSKAGHKSKSNTPQCPWRPHCLGLLLSQATDGSMVYI